MYTVWVAHRKFPQHCISITSNFYREPHHCFFTLHFPSSTRPNRTRKSAWLRGSACKQADMISFAAGSDFTNLGGLQVLARCDCSRIRFTCNTVHRY